MAAGILQWNTPLPYLYGGLALVLGLIAVSLLCLACSGEKNLPPSETAAAEKAALPPGEETRIVVVMAGDDLPTHVAKPVS
ncbi:protein GLUTAMINE DUMPER 4-like [Diospyros lotus]|uniref:protein GLUTAMINE DUMPER 4-like n=1 Tax=Diospyros lotus TaxID=55363 RepID=UPI0022555557|nr:protein GLUTAMINE DUMPER 4-like [Diospyros lotus]